MMGGRACKAYGDDIAKAHVSRMIVQVRFYGRLARQIADEIALDCPACTVGEVRELVAASYPDSSGDMNSPLVRACVGDSLVDEDFRLDGAHPVEFFAPVSGG